MHQQNLLRSTVCFLAYLLLQSSLVAQSVTPEWTRSVNSRLDGTDIGKAICEDPSGNIILLGEMKQFASTGTEVSMQKYTSSGTLLWELTHHNVFQENDAAVDVEVDSSGNIYALLNSWVSTNSDQDILLQKYDPMGQLLWQAIYDGAGMDRDAGIELDVDPGGVSTVCGTSTSAQGRQEILVIRYDAGGSQVFQNLRTDPGNAYQQPQDMVIGPAGDVYVTGGNGPNGGSGANEVCIYRVNPSGATVWDTTYLPIMLSPGQIRGVEIDLTPSGNTIVFIEENSFYEAEIRLLALDPTGQEIGQNSKYLGYNPNLIPYAMGVGPDGNIYTTYQFTDSLYNEVKYLWKCDPALQTIWERPIDFTYSVLPEVLHTLKFLPSGNLMLAGTRTFDSSYVYQPADLMAMELDTAGIKIREEDWNGASASSEVLTDFAIGANGEALLTGQMINTYTNRDMVGGKMDLVASNDWYEMTGRDVNGADHFIAMKKDGNGNIYLGGRTLGNNSLTGFHIAKFDPSGNMLFDTTHFSPVGRSYWAMDMDVDASGNIAMTAHGSTDFVGGGALYLYKFSPNGAVLWWDSLQTNTAGLSYTSKAVSFDGSGNVYMAANDKFHQNKRAWYLAKYNANGSRIWGHRLLPQNPGPIYGFGDVTKIIPDGNEVWVGGQLDGKMAYRKLDQGGTVINSMEYFAAYSNSNIDFEIDPFGNPIMLGRADDSLVGGYHWGTFKFDPAGNLLWHDRIPGNVFASSEPEETETDASGNVYVCGRDGYYKYSVAKYDPNGNLIWKQDYGNGTYAQRVGARALLPTPGGGMVSCGLNGGLPAQVRVVNTNPGGWANWTYDYSGPASESAGLGILHGNGGELYVAGYGIYDTTGRDLMLIKFSQVTAIDDGILSEVPVLYPNPTSGMINVEWGGLLEGQDIRYEVIDLKGRIILANSVAGSGMDKGHFPVDISVLRPGMYFMRLENGLGASKQAKFLVQ